MNEHDLHRILTAATETVDEPNDEFVAGLRRRLDVEPKPRPQSAYHQEDVMVVELDNRPQEETAERPHPNRRLIMLGVAAAIVVAVGLAAVIRAGEDGRTVSAADDPPTSVADDGSIEEDAAPTPDPLPTEPIEVGEAWLQSIIDNDRDTFVALHAPDFTANDTLMVWRTLSFDDVPDYYFDGFDALAVSLASDGDEIWVDGCTEELTGRIG